MANDPENVNPTPTIEDLPDAQVAGDQAGQTLVQAGDSSVTLEGILASPEFKALVDKEIQRKTDKQFGKHGTRLDKLESPEGTIERYEALQAQGMSKDQAMSKMQGDKELADTRARLSVLEGKAPDVSAGAGAQGWKERRASILSDAGIDGNDPRFIDFMKQKFSSYDDMNVKLFEKAEGWSFTDETKPKPSASTVAQTIPSIPAGDVDATEKYKQDMIAARGNARLGRQVKLDARKAGVDVDNIGFGDRVTP